MTHQKRHAAHASLKPRDPYSALAASDAYCGLQIEAVRSGRKCADTINCLGCPEGQCSRKLAAERRYRFLNGA